MSLEQEAREAYEVMIARRETCVEAEAVFEDLRLEAIARHAEELRGARTNEVRKEILAILMIGDNEYELARDNAATARLEFEKAKYRVEMVKLIAGLEAS